MNTLKARHTMQVEMFEEQAVEQKHAITKYKEDIEKLIENHGKELKSEYQRAES